MLGIWVMRNVHPGTSVAVTTLESRIPEQPLSIHHKQVYSVSSQLRHRQQYDFIRARTVGSQVSRLWLLRKQTSAGLAPWRSVLQV
jgi:hypothetical protein